MNPTPIPTGWEMLQSFSLQSSDAGALVVVPNPEKWRKYVIGVHPLGLEGFVLTHAQPALTTPTALEINPNYPTFYGPFAIEAALYLGYVGIAPAVKYPRITLFVSVEGEIDELVRYLHGLGYGSQDWAGNWVDDWTPQEFVEGGGVDFGASSVRNYHPILQLSTNSDDPVGGTVLGVLPDGLPVSWGSCTVRVAWAPGTSPVMGNKVVLGVAFERNEKTFDLDGDAFAAAILENPVVPLTDGLVTYTDFLVDQANADGLLPGESFRILLTRIPADVADTYAGIVQVTGMSMWINK